MTRSAFILRGALATTAALGASAATGFVGRAMAQGGENDADVFRLALTLELLEAAFYEQALRRVDMSADNRRLAELVGAHEREHVTRLQQVLDRLGESYSSEANLRFNFPLASEDAFLALAVKLEDTGVSAYSGAAPQVRSAELLALAGSIVQTEARHAAALRAAAGESFAPRAFDRAIPLTRAVADAVPYIQRL
jgi:rubrerythrin